MATRGYTEDNSVLRSSSSASSMQDMKLRENRRNRRRQNWLRERAMQSTTQDSETSVIPETTAEDSVENVPNNSLCPQKKKSGLKKMASKIKGKFFKGKKNKPYEEQKLNNNDIALDSDNAIQNSQTGDNKKLKLGAKIGKQIDKFFRKGKKKSSKEPNKSTMEEENICSVPAISKSLLSIGCLSVKTAHFDALSIGNESNDREIGLNKDTGKNATAAKYYNANEINARYVFPTDKSPLHSEVENAKNFSTKLNPDTVSDSEVEKTKDVIIDETSLDLEVQSVKEVDKELVQTSGNNTKEDSTKGAVDDMYNWLWESEEESAKDDGVKLGHLIGIGSKTDTTEVPLHSEVENTKNDSTKLMHGTGNDSEVEITKDIISTINETSLDLEVQNVKKVDKKTLVQTSWNSTKVDSTKGAVDMYNLLWESEEESVKDDGIKLGHLIGIETKTDTSVVPPERPLDSEEEDEKMIEDAIDVSDSPWDSDDESVEDGCIKLCHFNKNDTKLGKTKVAVYVDKRPWDTDKESVKDEDSKLGRTSAKADATSGVVAMKASLMVPKEAKDFGRKSGVTTNNDANADTNKDVDDSPWDSEDESVKDGCIKLCHFNKVAVYVDKRHIDWDEEIAKVDNFPEDIVSMDSSLIDLEEEIAKEYGIESMNKLEDEIALEYGIIGYDDKGNSTKEATIVNESLADLEKEIAKEYGIDGSDAILESTSTNESLLNLKEGISKEHGVKKTHFSVHDTLISAKDDVNMESVKSNNAKDEVANDECDWNSKVRSVKEADTRLDNTKNDVKLDATLDSGIKVDSVTGNDDKKIQISMEDSTKVERFTSVKEVECIKDSSKMISISKDGKTEDGEDDCKIQKISHINDKTVINSVRKDNKAVSFMMNDSIEFKPLPYDGLPVTNVGSYTSIKSDTENINPLNDKTVINSVRKDNKAVSFMMNDSIEFKPLPYDGLPVTNVGSYTSIKSDTENINPLNDKTVINSVNKDNQAVSFIMNNSIEFKPLPYDGLPVTNIGSYTSIKSDTENINPLNDKTIINSVRKDNKPVSFIMNDSIEFKPLPYDGLPVTNVGSYTSIKSDTENINSLNDNTVTNSVRKDNKTVSFIMDNSTEDNVTEVQPLKYDDIPLTNLGSYTNRKIDTLNTNPLNEKTVFRKDSKTVSLIIEDITEDNCTEVKPYKYDEDMPVTYVTNRNSDILNTNPLNDKTVINSVRKDNKAVSLITQDITGDNSTEVNSFKYDGMPVRNVGSYTNKEENVHDINMKNTAVTKNSGNIETVKDGYTKDIKTVKEVKSEESVKHYNTKLDIKEDIILVSSVKNEATKDVVIQDQGHQEENMVELNAENQKQTFDYMNDEQLKELKKSKVESVDMSSFLCCQIRLPKSTKKTSLKNVSNENLAKVINENGKKPAKQSPRKKEKKVAWWKKLYKVKKNGDPKNTDNRKKVKNSKTSKEKSKTSKEKKKTENKKNKTMKQSPRKKEKKVAWWKKLYKVKRVKKNGDKKNTNNRKKVKNKKTSKSKNKIESKSKIKSKNNKNSKTSKAKNKTENKKNKTTKQSPSKKEKKVAWWKKLYKVKRVKKNGDKKITDKRKKIKNKKTSKSKNKIESKNKIKSKNNKNSKTSKAKKGTESKKSKIKSKSNKNKEKMNLLNDGKVTNGCSNSDNRAMRKKKLQKQKNKKPGVISRFLCKFKSKGNEKKCHVTKNPEKEKLKHKVDKSDTSNVELDSSKGIVEQSSDISDIELDSDISDVGLDSDISDVELDSETSDGEHDSVGVKVESVDMKTILCCQFKSPKARKEKLSNKKLAKERGANGKASSDVEMTSDLSNVEQDSDTSDEELDKDTTNMKLDVAKDKKIKDGSKKVKSTKRLKKVKVESVDMNTLLCCKIVVPNLKKENSQKEVLNKNHAKARCEKGKTSSKQSPGNKKKTNKKTKHMAVVNGEKKVAWWKKLFKRRQAKNNADSDCKDNKKEVKNKKTSRTKSGKKSNTSKIKKKHNKNRKKNNLAKKGKVTRDSIDNDNRILRKKKLQKHKRKKPGIFSRILSKFKSKGNEKTDHVRKEKFKLKHKIGSDTSDVELDSDISDVELDSDISDVELDSDISDGELDSDISDGELDSDISDVELDSDISDLEPDSDTSDMDCYANTTDSEINDTTDMKLYAAKVEKVKPIKKKEVESVNMTTILCCHIRSPKSRKQKSRKKVLNKNLSKRRCENDKSSSDVDINADTTDVEIDAYTTEAKQELSLVSVSSSSINSKNLNEISGRLSARSHSVKEKATKEKGMSGCCNHPHNINIYFNIPEKDESKYQETTALKCLDYKTSIDCDENGEHQEEKPVKMCEESLHLPCTSVDLGQQGTKKKNKKTNNRSKPKSDVNNLIEPDQQESNVVATDLNRDSQSDPNYVDNMVGEIMHSEMKKLLKSDLGVSANNYDHERPTIRSVLKNQAKKSRSNLRKMGEQSEEINSYSEINNSDLINEMSMNKPTGKRTRRRCPQNDDVHDMSCDKYSEQGQFSAHQFPLDHDDTEHHKLKVEGKNKSRSRIVKNLRKKLFRSNKVGPLELNNEPQCNETEKFTWDLKPKEQNVPHSPRYQNQMNTCSRTDWVEEDLHERKGNPTEFCSCHYERHHRRRTPTCSIDGIQHRYIYPPTTMANIEEDFSRRCEQNWAPRQPCALHSNAPTMYPDYQQNAHFDLQRGRSTDPTLYSNNQQSGMSLPGTVHYIQVIPCMVVLPTVTTLPAPGLPSVEYPSGTGNRYESNPSAGMPYDRPDF